MMQRFNLPPGPPPIGNNPLKLLRYMRRFRQNPAGMVAKRFERYGDIYYAPLGKTKLYVVRHPDDIRQVLLQQASKFQKTETGNAARQLRRVLGDGLLNSNGEIWRRQRRMINPAFHRKRLKNYGGVMVNHTERMLDGWLQGNTVDISDAMMRLTLRIVAHALFDHDVTSDSDTVAQTMAAFRASIGLPALLPSWLPLPSIQRVQRALIAMDEIVYGLIEARQAMSADDAEKRNDLLTVLARAIDEEALSATQNDIRAQMTRKQLRDELLTLFLAGHETTSHALTWTWYLLSQNPDVEARLHEELDTVLDGRTPTVADLNSLSYTKLVLTEAMRLYPPAYVISREAKEHTKLGGYDVPTGSEVLVWIYMTHHDARWYPEPEAFRPERFAEDAEPEIPQCAYLPFGAGQRTCVGKHFAMMEAQLILATVAQRYRLRLVPNHDVKKDLSVTLSPRGPVPMVLISR